MFLLYACSHTLLVFSWFTPRAQILFYFGHQDKIQTFNMWFVYLHLCVFVLLENLRSSRTTVTAHEIAFKVQHGALNHNEPCAKHF